MGGRVPFGLPQLKQRQNELQDLLAAKQEHRTIDVLYRSTSY